ncbi:MAG: hypothetical protein WC444_03085 [Candidatus Paceibacterota bacterium]
MKTILVLVKVLLAILLIASSQMSWSQTTAKATTTTVVLTYADLVKMQEDVAKAQKDALKMQESLVKAQEEMVKMQESALKAQKAAKQLEHTVSSLNRVNKKLAEANTALTKTSVGLKKEITEGQQQALALGGKIQALEAAQEQQKISEAGLRVLIATQSTALWSVGVVFFGLMLCLSFLVWRMRKDLIRTTEITTDNQTRSETAINVSTLARNIAKDTAVKITAEARVAGTIANEATIGLSQIKKFVGFQDISFPPDFETMLAGLSAENKTYQFTVTCSDSSNKPIHLAVEWKRPGFVAICGIEGQTNDVKIKDVKTMIGRAGKLDRNGDHRLVGVRSDQGNLKKGARTTICTLKFAYATTHCNVNAFRCTTYTVKPFRMKLRH